MKKFLLIVLVLLANNLFSQNITDNLLLYYPFNGNTNDTSGNGNNGTSYGVTYGPDRFGNANSAAYFNGTNNFVNFPNVASLKTSLPVSFSFWVKYANMYYQNQVIFNTSFENDRSSGVWFNSTSSSGCYAANYGDGSYAYTSATRRTYVSDTSINANIWHHVLVIVNGPDDMKIYIDCQEDGGYFSGSGGSLVYSITPGCIGRHDRDLALPPDYFKGYIDDFRYWNRALTVSEVGQLCSTLSTEEQLVTTDIFNVYPNPASDVIRFETNLTDLQSIVIYDAMGNEVLHSNYQSELAISSLSKGIYFIKVNSESATLSKKLIIN
ncbi:LamG-like jellyroll fold domain-containing protein [Flavobacterium sp. SUN046]|uniref:LamG-like jellyroll fold domain-containing protein n=1 Tax=Flavobacterium sp. SUN046 TaxID=3002440 RepID=UPI002DBACB78|nr:LamG-like jellyroll fold domain-containing protein [Flavobacterium sp. SUN046]MEC4049686.1 LamG-like jellyroll fold domain-containing protein [Flavobacterium sp. SUN046]